MEDRPATAFVSFAMATVAVLVLVTYVLWVNGEWRRAGPLMTTLSRPAPPHAAAFRLTPSDLRHTIFVAVPCYDDIAGAAACAFALLNCAACPDRITVGVLLDSDEAVAAAAATGGGLGCLLNTVEGRYVSLCSGAGAPDRSAQLRVAYRPLADARGPAQALGVLVCRMYAGERHVLTLNACARAQPRWDELLLQELAAAQRHLGRSQALLTAPLAADCGGGSSPQPFAVVARRLDDEGEPVLRPCAPAGPTPLPVRTLLWLPDLCLVPAAAVVGAGAPAPLAHLADTAPWLDGAAALWQGARLDAAGWAMYAPRRTAFRADGPADLDSCGRGGWRAALNGDGESAKAARRLRRAALAGVSAAFGLQVCRHCGLAREYHAGDTAPAGASHSFLSLSGSEGAEVAVAAGSAGSRSFRDYAIRAGVAPGCLPAVHAVMGAEALPDEANMVARGGSVAAFVALRDRLVAQGVPTTLPCAAI